MTDPAAVFRRSRVVQARDLDALDHVNNVVWVRFVVELANAHSCSVGLDLDTLRGLGGVWVVQRHELDYHRAAGLGDEIDEATWVSEMRGARCLRHASAGPGTDRSCSAPPRIGPSSTRTAVALAACPGRSWPGSPCTRRRRRIRRPRPRERPGQFTNVFLTRFETRKYGMKTVQKASVVFRPSRILGSSPVASSGFAWAT